MCTAPIYLSYLTWNLWTNHQFFIWTLLDSLPSKLHTNLSSLSRRLRLKMISELSRVWLITWDWCSVLINSFVIPNVRLRDLKGWSFFFGRQRAYTTCLGNPSSNWNKTLNISLKYWPPCCRPRWGCRRSCAAQTRCYQPWGPPLQVSACRQTFIYFNILSSELQSMETRSQSESIPGWWILLPLVIKCRDMC